MSTTLWVKLEASLSKPRLAPYLETAQGNQALALRLYRWNSEISAAFLEVLGPTEVAVLGLQDEVAEGFEVLFSEVIVPNENGIWEVDLEAAARVVPEMTLEELQAAANFINYGPGAQVSARGAAEDGRCVAESFLPGFINYSDAVRIGERLQARDWSGAASVLTQAWASAAAGNALIYGASEGLRLFLKNNPAVFAARLAVYAGTCALTS